MYGDFEGSLTVSQQVYAGCRLARSLQIQVHAGLLPHERTLKVRDCLPAIHHINPSNRKHTESGDFMGRTRTNVQTYSMSQNS